MSDDDLGRPPTPFRYHVELTPAQLKIAHTALRSLLEDFDDEDSGVRAVIEEVLGKLPDESAMRAVRLDAALDDELRRRDPRDPGPGGRGPPDGEEPPPPAAA